MVHKYCKGKRGPGLLTVEPSFVFQNEFKYCFIIYMIYYSYPVIDPMTLFQIDLFSTCLISVIQFAAESIRTLFNIAFHC